MATPFVAASVALLLSKDINMNADDVCDLLQENAKPFTYFPDITYYKLYIAEITEYNQDRTIKPEFSVEGGRYSDSVTVELSCDEENAEIYYTLDGSRASKANGILYTEPIIIDKVTKIHAAAYAPNKIKSLQAIADYYITTTDPEGNFEIDTDGKIIAYKGNNQYLTIPDTINGIEVTGIGESVFYQSDIIMIKFPDTLTFVEDSAFAQSKSLKSVYSGNLKSVGKRGFYTCKKLENIDFTQLEDVDEYGFAGCSLIQDIYNDKLTVINKCAFNNLRNAISISFPNVKEIKIMGLNGLNIAEYINLPKVEILDSYALMGANMMQTIYLPELKTTNGKNNTISGSNIKKMILPKLTEFSSKSIYSCQDLETLYIPNVTVADAISFKYSNAIKTIFAPKLTNTSEFPKSNATIYLSENFNGSTSVLDEEYKYTIIAPSGSYAEQWAKENGHTFIPSDYRDESIAAPANVTDLGRSICCSAAGVRFGFTWDNIDEIESLAADIKYGFIYSQKGAENLSIDTVDGKNIKKTVANNRIDHGDTTSFNLVISNIPNSYYDREITARAYVCIDGMYFYSNILKGSFSEVAQLVLADNEIDTNTKNAINNLLSKEV